MCVLVWVCFIEPERYVVGQWWPSRVLCHPFLYFLKLALGRGSFSGSSFLLDSASVPGWATSSSHESSVISSNGPPLGKKLWPLTAFYLLCCVFLGLLGLCTDGFSFQLKFLVYSWAPSHLGWEEGLLLRFCVISPVFITTLHLLKGDRWLALNVVFHSVSDVLYFKIIPQAHILSWFPASVQVSLFRMIPGYFRICWWWRQSVRVKFSHDPSFLPTTSLLLMWCDWFAVRA